MQKFVLLQPGDWPCQFYCRQIIYHYLGKFHRSYSQPTNTLQETLFTSNDHSFYSYPTGNYVCNMTCETMSQQPSILSIVPTTGPLHISLNSREHNVNSFQPFFKSVYQSIFPNSKLADKPKPWRVSLILEIVYGGWPLIRQTVMQKFCQFKDPQYGTLLNLLDNYIPFALSIYIISFKLNHFSEHFRAIIRIWIMFICLQRRHYNKAPLVWINMCLHWGNYSLHLYQLLQNYITDFDEYPVENTHSILRAQTKPSDTADELRKKANAIFQSKEKQSNFKSFFTSPKQFSFSHNQLQFLKVKCTKVLTDTVKKNCTGPGRGFFFYVQRQENYWSCDISDPPCVPTYQPRPPFCLLDTTVISSLTTTKKCDLPGCNISTPNESWPILTGCFHSFHCKCLDESTSCPLCKDFLQTKVQELGEIAKEAILHPHATDTDDHNESTTASMTDSTGDEENHGVREMEREEYENLIEKLNNKLANLSPPPQPCVASYVNQ